MVPLMYTSPETENRVRYLELTTRNRTDQRFLDVLYAEYNEYELFVDLYCICYSILDRKDVQLRA